MHQIASECCSQTTRETGADISKYLAFCRRYSSTSLSFRSQRGRDHVGAHAVDFQRFPPAGAPGNDAHAAPRDAEMLRNEIYQGAIGGILNRRRGNADLDHTVMHARKLRLGGARLDVDVKANGRHMNAILPGCLYDPSGDYSNIRLQAECFASLWSNANVDSVAPEARSPS